MSRRIITKIVYGKFIKTRKGVKARVLKSKRFAEWAEVECDKPDRNGSTGLHLAIEDDEEFEVGNFFIETQHGTFIHKKSDMS